MAGRNGRRFGTGGMRVLGIDPGIERLGYAVIDDASSGLSLVSYGLVTTDKSLPKPERFAQIYDDVVSLVEQYRPEVLSLETLLFAKNVKTAMTVSEVRGILILISMQKGLLLKELTPLQVKTVVTGYGKADKVQMQNAIKMLFALREIPKPDDVADAIGIALCGIVKG